MKLFVSIEHFWAAEIPLAGKATEIAVCLDVVGHMPGEVQLRLATSKVKFTEQFVMLLLGIPQLGQMLQSFVARP